MSQTETPQQVSALVLWDALRLRAWIAGLRRDRTGAVMLLALTLAALIGLGVAALRLTRLPHADWSLAGAGAVVALIASGAQAGLGRSLAFGPVEALIPARPAVRLWAALRTALAGALPLLALSVGAGLGGAGPHIAMAAGAFALTVTATAWRSEPTGMGVEAPPPTGLATEGRATPDRGLWALPLIAARARRGLLPAWLAALAIAVLGAVAARLAAAHGAPEAAAGAALAAGLLAGAALNDADPDLVTLLGATPQPLWKLLALIGLAPAAAGLGAGLVAAIAAGPPLAEPVAAGLAGGAICLLWVLSDALNLLAFGSAGPVRTAIYAAGLVLAAQLVGPGAALAAVAGLAVLYRIAARRRWSRA